MHPRRQIAAFAFTLSVALAGCGGVAPGSAGSPTGVPVAVGTNGPTLVGTGGYTPLAVPTAVATGTRIGSMAGPTDTPGSSAPLPTHSTVLESHSPHVPVGKPYDFSLYTHCGIDFAVDFDGSFWDLIPLTPTGGGQGNPLGLGNPMQQGTMTLLDATHARFTYSGGEFEFTRHVGPKIVPGLCM